MQHQGQEAGSSSGGLYSVKSCEKAVSDSSRAEHIQDVHVRCVKKWPGTESLSVEYRSLLHPASKGAEENFFSQMKISSLLRRFSISKLTDFMISTSRETHDKDPERPTSCFSHGFVGSIVWCHHQPPFLWKRGENLCQSLWEHRVELVLKLFNNTLFSNEHWSFKQDLAPAHKANSTKAWLQGIFQTQLHWVIPGLLALQQLRP